MILVYPTNKSWLMEKFLFAKLKNIGGFTNSKSDQSIRDSRKDNFEVTSKYFKPKEECVMESDLDDSIEFVKKRPNKTVVKKAAPKRKTKKKANNVKSHDLRTYASDFDKVCKANSVDVNSEELQLAIALSKSISDYSNKHSDNEVIPSHSNDTRLSKIRKTLEEFGFKIKSASVSKTELSKKLNNRKRGNYHLIKLTNKEKHQLINNNVSQILNENFVNQKHSSNDRRYNIHSEILKESLCITNCCFNKNRLPYKDSVDEINNYYVRDLIVPSSSKVGCLLKDWRVIPGREKSPERHVEPINIQEHCLYKRNFDLLLTGKYSEINKEIIPRIVDSPYKSNELIMDAHKNNINTMPRNRSDSPDIFGDTFESNADVNQDSIIIDKIDLSNCDEELDILKDKMNQLNENSLKHRSMSYSYKNDSLSEDNNGIIHYESYYESSFVEVDNESDGDKLSSKNGENDVNGSSNIYLNDDNIKKLSLQNIDNKENKSSVSHSSERCNMSDTSVIVSEKSYHVSSFKEIDKDTDGILNDGNVDQRSLKTLDNEDDKLSLCSSRSYNMNTSDERENMNTSLPENKEDNLSQVFVISDDERDFSVKPLYQNPELQAKYQYFISSDEEMEETMFKTSPILNEDLVHSKMHRSSILYSNEGNTSSDKSSNSKFTENNESNVFINKSIENLKEVITSKSLCSGKSYKDVIELPVLCSKDTTINNSLEKNTSQDNVDSSQVFVILDDELDYSLKRINKMKSKSRNFVSSDEELEDKREMFRPQSKNKDSQLLFSQDDQKTVHSKMYRSSILDIDKTHSSPSVSMNKSEEINKTNINENDRLNELYSSRSFEEMKGNSINNSLQESTESSQVFVISDDELDYSVNKLHQNSKSQLIFRDDQKESELALNNAPQSNCSDDNQNIKPTVHSKMYRSSILDTIYSFDSTNIQSNNYVDCQSIRQNEELIKLNDKSIDDQKHNEDITVSSKSPIHNLYRTMMNDKCNAETPENSKYILKTENVTPLIDFNSLGSPDIAEELSKYGLKPIKRKRAVQILEHIYEQTHPTVNIKDFQKERKKRKLEEVRSDQIVTEAAVDDWSNDSMNNDENVTLKKITQHSEDLNNVNMYEKDCDFKHIKYIDYNIDDVILPLRKNIKIHSCSVPLHIAFHNYLVVRSKLRNAVLKYEPIDIEMVHRGLKENGFNYNPKDLMRFLDRKCITIKINAKEQGKRCPRTKK